MREQFSRFPFCGSSYRQGVGSEVYVIRLSVQSDCWFFVKCLLLWRQLCGGCDEPFDALLSLHPTLRTCSSDTILRGIITAAASLPRKRSHPLPMRAAC